MEAPTIKPHPTKQWDVAQSRHEHLPKVPFRMIISAPGGSGKTILIQNMIVDLYKTKGGKSVFQRVYIFSPSCKIDPAWEPVISFCQKHLNQDDEEEPFLFEVFRPSDLHHILETQRKVNDIAKKKKGNNRLFSILIVMDDIADNEAVARREQMIHSLFVRHRHIQVSTCLSTQKYRSLANILRVNATALILFRARSQAELDVIMEENSAVIGKKPLLALYYEATSRPHGFLYIDLTAQSPYDMFWRNFEERLLKGS
jgi:hypothetical protein